MADKARILVVEDDPVISLDVAGALEEFGYEVVGSVPSGKEAIELALAQKPDLILMDINIKGELDGIQTAEAIHKQKPTAVIFLTALADEETLQRARLVGPYGYLIKPFDPAELHSTIDIALDRYKSSEHLPFGQEDGDGLEELATSLGLAGSAQEKAALLKSIAFFESLPEAQLVALASCCEVTSVNAGEFIHLEDPRPERAFVVLTGRVSVKKVTPAGKELILGLLGPGDCFGMLPMVASYAIEAAARAQLESKLLAFPRPLFTRILKEVPLLNDLLTAELMRRLSLSYDLAVSLAHSRVEARILGAINTLLDTMAKSSPHSRNEMRIFITRKELADLTGTTPETAIRVTKQLERDGVLDLTRPGVIKVPDVAKLRDLI